MNHIPNVKAGDILISTDVESKALMIHTIVGKPSRGIFILDRPCQQKMMYIHMVMSM